MNQNSITEFASRGEIVARYKQLRAVSRDLNNRLTGLISKDVLDEAGKKLGMLQNGTLVFDIEDETCVLMDYCLYDVRRKGCNAIEQYLIDSPPDPDSDEMTCLRAMQNASYSLFVVETVERGLGVTAKDLRTNETLLIVDLGFSSTAQSGLILASRVLPHDGFYMTSGAALPIGMVPAKERDTVTRELLRALPKPDDGLFDPAPLISECLRQGSSSHVQYQTPARTSAGRQQKQVASRAGKLGRNAPCPCGSGKKFKQCCMRQR